MWKIQQLIYFLLIVLLEKCQPEDLCIYDKFLKLEKEDLRQTQAILDSFKFKRLDICRKIFSLSHG